MEYALLLLLAIPAIYHWVNRDQSQKLFYSDPNPYYSQDFTRYVVDLFVVEWCKQYPRDEKRFRRAIKNLKIVWSERRMFFQGRTVLGASIDGQTTIWIGPLRKDGTRNILHTALLDQLGKLAAASNDRTVTDSEIKKVIINVSKQIQPTVPTV